MGKKSKKPSKQVKPKAAAAAAGPVPPAQWSSAPVPPLDDHHCALCGKGGAKSKCSDCRQVSYCSRDCQKAHWKTHKSVCTQACVIVHHGNILDVATTKGPRDHLDQRKTEFSIRITLPRTKNLSKWLTGDTPEGHAECDALLERTYAQRFALRDDWVCVFCGDRGTRICSRRDALAIMRKNTPPYDMQVADFFSFATCDRADCAVLAQEFLDASAASITRLLGENVGGLPLLPDA